MERKRDLDVTKEKMDKLVEKLYLGRWATCDDLACTQGKLSAGVLLLPPFIHQTFKFNAWFQGASLNKCTCGRGQAA